MAESLQAYEAQAALAAAARRRKVEIHALGRQLLPLGFIDPDRGVAVAEHAARLSSDLDDALSQALARMQAAAYRCVYDRWSERDWQTWSAASERARESDTGPLPPYLRSMHRYLLLLRGEHDRVLRELEAEPGAADPAWALMPDLLATSARTLALLRAGRFGELLQLARMGQEMAARNGTDPWLFVLREAWLHILVLDFDGAGRLCYQALSAATPQPASQLTTIAWIADGYSLLEQGKYAQAIECFERVAEPPSTPKFFLHWLWRMTARHGLADAWLIRGSPAEARRHAGVLLEAALASADPHSHAFAWELQARVAAAGQDRQAAEGAIRQALDVLEAHDVPTMAWRVHATAWEVLGDALHLERAATCVGALADSFPAGEPLRETFLSAAPVKRIVDNLRKARRPRTMDEPGS